MKKIYYAHCKSIYNTEQEKRHIKTLEDLGFEVINPNTEEHQEKCKNIFNKIGEPDPMSYFYTLVSDCDALAFASLPNFTLTAGVYKEVCLAIQLNKPVIELPNFSFRDVLEVEQTRQYLKECGQR